MPIENGGQNPEDVKKIIPSSDRETSKTREQRAKEAEAEKAKEKLKVREKLDKAVKQLEKMRMDLPTGSAEFQRVEHTLKSIHGALAELGKNGSPKGKYAVEVKGYNGQVAYVQNEGVPVDEVIKLLKLSVEKIKQENTPTKLKELKKKRDELFEEYKRSSEVTDKANKYSQYEKTNKEYEKMREEVETGNPTATQLSALAEDLQKSSKTYFEARADIGLTKEHGENPNVWTQEQRQRQNLRTRHEALLMHKDHRGSKNQNDDERQGEDYRKAMEVMKDRRELDLEEQEEDLGPVYGPEDDPKKKEKIGPLGPTGPEINLPDRVVLVNAEAQVELLARERANKRLTEMQNSAGFLKKMWLRGWEEGYRQQLIAEERKKILGQENKPGWFKRKLFGAQSIEATGKKNLFAGTGNEGENRAELSALGKRFADGYIHKSEGEQKKQLEDPEFNSQVEDLVDAYMRTDMSDEDFDNKKDILVEAIAKKHPENFRNGGLTADNLLEAAKEYRKIHQHGQGLARADVKLGIDLGVAKQAIKTKANLNWVDKFITKVQKYPVLGNVLTPGMVGFGASIGGFFAKKPLYWLGGAAGLGGVLGASRRNFEQKRDLEMHRTERAMGNKIEDYGSGAKRRKEQEKFVYEMRSVAEIKENLEALQERFKNESNEANAQALNAELADVEARMSLSDFRGSDLISFEGETSLERGRLYLMKNLAEGKVLLQKAGFQNGVTSEVYKKSKVGLETAINKLDKSERWHRWGENAKSAVVGATVGLVVGGLSQEVAAKLGDNVSWLHWLRPGGKATGMEKLAEATGLSHRAGFGWLDHGVHSGGVPDILHPGSLDAVIKVDSSTELVRDGTTNFWSLRDKIDHAHILGRFDVDPTTGHVTPSGPISPEISLLPEHSESGGHRAIAEWMDTSKTNFGPKVQSEIWHTTGFLDNNTPMPKVDFNELRFYMQFDAHGNLSMDASKIQEYMENTVGEQIRGSKHGDTALTVMEEFAKGNIKLGFAPDPNHPQNILNLIFDSVTHKFLAPDGGNLMNAFGVDANGHPVLKGDGLLGMVHDLGGRPDGSRNVEWINAIRGNGEAINTGNGSHLVNEITRKTSIDFWQPTTYIDRRKPLEVLQGGKNKEKGKEPGKDGGQEPNGKDGKQLPKRIIGTDGKEHDFKIEFFEGDDEDPLKKIEGKKIKAVKVDTRGQKIEQKVDAKTGKLVGYADRKDYGKDYPTKFPFKDEAQMADYLMGILKPGGKFAMHSEDLKKFDQMDEAGKKRFLVGRIQQDRQALISPEGHKIESKEWQGLTEIVLAQVNQELDLYGKEGRSELPAQDKVHIVGVYEYQAQAELAGKESLGVCFANAGEIFVNFDMLKQVCPTMEELIPQLKRTVAHETIHDAVANNYWAYEIDDGPDTDLIGGADAKDKKKQVAILSRRTGLKFVRRNVNKNRMVSSITERGRTLNEAVTETLSKDITDKIYGKEKGPKPKYSQEPYAEERALLTMIEKKFNIPFKAFAEAVVNRKKLGELARLLDGQDENRVVQRPQFTSLLMSVMDFDHNRHQYEYKQAKQLIQGMKGIAISKEMKLSFPVSLLDQNGDIKKRLVDAYGLIDVDAEVRNPIPKVA